MTLENISANSQIATGLSWSGQELAKNIDSSDQLYLRYINFAAAAESSTQNAFLFLSTAIPKAQQDASENGNHILAQFLENFNQWLTQWVVEEANHVDFFCRAKVQLKNKINSQHILNSEDQIDPSKISGEIFGVELPIPDNQSWQTTLLFLLYSEIASMIWYRVWYHRVEMGGLRNALRHLQNDEGEHFQKFLDLSKELAQMDPSFVHEARRIFLLYALNFRKLISRSRNQANGQKESKEQINWWEHPIFAQIENVESVIQKIISTQKFALSCIQKAAL